MTSAQVTREQRAKVYDAIIVGARCAGSPTAMLLARKGYKILMVDRAGFPSDTMSGHYIHQPGVACLERWGLRDAVAATNCPPISTIRFDLGPFALEGQPPAADGVTEAFCCRRYRLDQILIDAAVAAGAELRERVSVEGLVWEDGEVRGIRTASGTETGRIVIGADGVHSRIARLVNAPMYEHTDPLSFGYYTYWTGIDTGGKVRLLPRGDRFIGVLPTNDDKALVFYQAPIAQFHEHRTDIEGHYFEAMNRDSWLAEQLSHATRTERFAGTADLPNFFRRPYGPGWALIGDAGYHKDPITGQGITDAFHCSEFLAEAIDAAFTGRKPIGEAMAEYEAKRNQLVGPLYHFTLDLARCEPPTAEMQQLMGALQGNQAAINDFLGCIAGTTNIPRFFSEENVGQIMAAAAMPAGAH
jgi:flavin-dependent dehydrogenase